MVATGIWEANVSTETHSGKPVHYIPLYLAPYVAEGVGGADELARLGLAGDSIMAPLPDLSDYQ